MTSYKNLIHLIVACLLLASGIINIWAWSLMNSSNNWTLLISTNAYGEHNIEIVLFIFSVFISLIAIYLIYKEG